VILGYLGAGALLAGLVLAGFSALLSFWAGVRESPVFIQVARRAFYAAAGMTVLAAVLLEAALLTHDFSLAYVAEHTDLATPMALVAARKDHFFTGRSSSASWAAPRSSQAHGSASVSPPMPRGFSPRSSASSSLSWPWWPVRSSCYRPRHLTASA